MFPDEMSRVALWRASTLMTPYEKGLYKAWLAQEPALEQYPARSGDTTLSLIMSLETVDAAAAATLTSIRTQSGRVEILLAAPPLSVGESETTVDGVAIVHGRDGDLPENAALAQAKGVFVAFISPGDQLREGALDFVLGCLDAHPKTELAFSSEDWIDDQGQRFMPRFKPEWDYYAQLSFDQPGRLCVMRRQTIIDLGGLNVAAAPAHHYDLHLRYGAQTKAGRILRWPHILYHRQEPRTVDSARAQACLDAYAEAARRAVTRQTGLPTCPAALNPFVNRPIFPLPEPAPLVSILVPTRDKVDLLRNCLSGVLERTEYPRIEVIILDNESSEANTLDYFHEVSLNESVFIIIVPGEFNYSKINNIGARAARGKILVFMNNDVAVITPGWLRNMVSLAVREDVGCVGAKLYYGDGLIQHAGVALEPGPLAMHVFRKSPPTELGRNGELAGLCSFSAVTAACLAIRKELFLSVGGFDEKKLKIAYNDVDLCLKVEEAGFNNVCTSFEPLFHLEGASRETQQDPDKIAADRAELANFLARWPDRFHDDRFSHPFVKRSWDRDDVLTVPERS